MVLALLACLGATAVQAENYPFPPGSSLRFRHITLEDGLAQSSVNAIEQDAQGYIWIGTQDGLQRYDGYDFLTYRHDIGDPASLADNDVNALAVDPRDRTGCPAVRWRIGAARTWRARHRSSKHRRESARHSPLP